MTRRPGSAGSSASRRRTVSGNRSPFCVGHPDGYPANLAYSPELWDWMAGLGFGLAYDPSHLPWLGIDPLDALEHALRSGIVGHVPAR